MNQETVDGLKRRFQDIEKFKYEDNYNKSVQEYLSFLTHNSITLNTTRTFFADNEFPDEFLLTIIFLLVEKDNYLLVPSKLPNESLLPLFKRVDFAFNKENKGKTPKKIELERQVAKIKSKETLISETQKESFLLNLSILNNKLIDKLNENNKNKEISYDFWITKDNIGNYLFNKNIISFSKNAEYVKIFDAVYSIKPNGGDILYKEIEKICKSKKLIITNKKVQQALTIDKANLFRHTKGLEQYPQYGIPLFKASSNGKYLTFNNKK